MSPSVPWLAAARALLLGVVLAVTPGNIGARSSEPPRSSGPSMAPAGSPGPSPAPSSAGSSPAADCTDLALLLPSELGDGLTLTAEVADDVAGLDPDDLLDPFLRTLGRHRADLCSVSIRYGAEPTDLVGLLLRVRGAGPGIAKVLAGALAERLREYGGEVSLESVDVPTGSATRLGISASGEETLLLMAAATTDSVLLTPSGMLLEVLLEALPPLAPGPSLTPDRAAGDPS